MNRKIAGCVCFLIIFLVGCASPEAETEQPYEGLHSQSEVLKDNGRHVKLRVEADETSAFIIDADVSISETALKQGIIQAEEWDIEGIADVLCSDIPLQPAEKNQPDYILYSGGDAYKDLPYDTALQICQLDGSLSYMNYRLDDYFTNSNYIIKRESEWTETDHILAGRMEDEAAALYEKLGLTAEIAQTELMTSGEGSYCIVKMARLLEDYPLLNATGYKVQDYIYAAECGINSIVFNMKYEEKDVTEVSVLSLDEVLTIVEKGVKEKSINAYAADNADDTVETISLAYMTEISDGALRFFPVWCFGADLDGYAVNYLLIDARDGSVVYMQ